MGDSIIYSVFCKSGVLLSELMILWLVAHFSGNRLNGIEQSFTPAAILSNRLSGLIVFGKNSI